MVSVCDNLDCGINERVGNRDIEKKRVGKGYLRKDESGKDYRNRILSGGEYGNGSGIVQEGMRTVGLRFYIFVF